MSQMRKRKCTGSGCIRNEKQGVSNGTPLHCPALHTCYWMDRTFYAFEGKEVKDYVLCSVPRLWKPLEGVEN